jgi:hypothetical protein
MKRYISDKIENAECTAASALIDLSKSYGAWNSKIKIR